MIHALGAITVPVAGTPRALSSTRMKVHAWMAEALPTNLGKVYIGLSTMNKTTLAGVIAILAIPTANLLPAFSVTVTDAPDVLELGDLWVDADINGEGVLVSAVQV